MLSELQEEIARLVRDLPDAEGFALAGGAALVLRGIVDRQTEDLDFFASSREAVGTLLPALERALETAGMQVERVRWEEGFARLDVRRGAAGCFVDLAWDVPVHSPEPSPWGPVYPELELAADKLLALYGRAEARDFVDVHALASRLGWHRLCELAAEKDSGFEPSALLNALNAFDRLPPDDFAVAEETYRRVRDAVVGWRDELRHGLDIASPSSPESLGPDDPGHERGLGPDEGLGL